MDSLHTAIDLNEKPSRDSLVETAEAEQTEREIAGSGVAGQVVEHLVRISQKQWLESLEIEAALPQVAGKSGS